MNKEFLDKVANECAEKGIDPAELEKELMDRYSVEAAFAQDVYEIEAEITEHYSEVVAKAFIEVFKK